MRIAEKGIKAVLKDRQITVVNGKPVELLEWKSFIDGLDQANAAIANWPNTLGLATFRRKIARSERAIHL